MLYLGEFHGSATKGNLGAEDRYGYEWKYARVIDTEAECSYCEQQASAGWKRHDWLDSGALCCNDCWITVCDYPGLPKID